MPAEFSVQLDPAELEAQRVAAALDAAHDGTRAAGTSGRRSLKAAPREAGRAKYAGRAQAAQQPRKYAFRRS